MRPAGISSYTVIVEGQSSFARREGRSAPLFAAGMAKMRLKTCRGPDARLQTPHEKSYMREAIRLSQVQMRAGKGGPFGAVVVRKGKIALPGLKCSR